MKYALIFFFCTSHGMYRESAVPKNCPYIHVETTTRVLNANTTFIDADNNNLVSDKNSVVEVVLSIHRPNRPVKTITLNVDI